MTSFVGCNITDSTPVLYIAKVKGDIKMGRHWGTLAYSRGMIRYTLSPYEQNAMYGFFKKGVPNMAKRVYSQVFKVVPPFVAAYMLIRWGDDKNAELSRKNPADYVDES